MALREFKLTNIFSSRDLSVVQHISDRIAVMYLEKIVEISATEVIFSKALHPYTKALLASAHILEPELRRERVLLKDSVTDPLNPPSGCISHPRYPAVLPKCAQIEPVLADFGHGYLVA
jgi:oligopeptide/dipeptide ABC transporter ATP-binding protein